MEMVRQMILDLSHAQLRELMRSLGEPGYRADQVAWWVYRKLATSFDQMTDLPQSLRFKLASVAALSSLTPVDEKVSTDGQTMKVLFRLSDGRTIESSLMLYAGTDSSRERRTVCVSTQVGCALGCPFCATGQQGFERNLQPGEIIEQVLYFMRLVSAEQGGGDMAPVLSRRPVTNVVFMGMGEPLANYDNLLAALAILMDERGPGFSERRVTVSTCGLPRRIRDLGRDARVNLAVSLHAADDGVRGSLMPVNATCGVDELLDACREFARAGKRVVFIECVLIAGVNDAPEDARRLAVKLRGIPCRVNLLTYNESAHFPFRRSPAARTAAFRDILHAAGLRTMVRQSRGADISAACGQLATGGGFASSGPACY